MATGDGRAKELIDLGDRLYTKRAPLLSFWQEIAENFYPERADFTRMHTLGEDFAEHLMDSYPVLMRRELGNSISAMLRPRDRPWFKTTTLDDALDEDEENARFLDYLTMTTRRRIYDPRSQFIRATKEGDHDFVTFGQTLLSIEESQDRDHLFFRSFHLKSSVWLENKMKVIDHLHRKDEMAARNMKAEFGEAKLHETIKKACEKEPDREFPIRHIVLPAHEYDYTGKGSKTKNNKRLPFVSIYIDVENCKVLREGGFAQFPYCIPRWHTISGWQYAFSPATVIALPDGRLAQQMARILLESGEKAVDPPAVAKMEAVREANIAAGALTWVDIQHDEKLSEAFQLLDFKGDMRTGFAMRADLREMLTKAFFLDKLNLPPAEGGDKMTAEEVRRRLEEFVRSALPLFEPMEVEYNTQILDKAFATLLNMNAFDFSEAPAALSDSNLSWQFESPIQAASSRLAVSQFTESLQLIGAATQAGITSVPVDLEAALRDALRATAKAKWIKPATQMAAEAEQNASQAVTSQIVDEVMTGAAVAGQVGEAAGKLRDGFTPPQNGTGTGKVVPMPRKRAA